MRSFAAACLALLVCPGAAALAQVDRRGVEAVPGEVVVRYASGVTMRERADVRADADVVVERSLSIAATQLVRAEDGDAEAAITTLEADPRVRYAEPNRIRRRASVTPNDARWGELYGLRKIGAPQAWDTTMGDPGVVVAVIDEGVDYDHPDLAAGMWANAAEVAGQPGVDDDSNGYVDDLRGWDFYGTSNASGDPGDNDPRDLGGHGTHVAGTIAARTDNAGVGVVGVAPRTSIMALRVLGPGGGTDADIADAFRYAARNGARIVNGSFGGPGFSQVMADSISASPQTLFVVAAGNENHDVDSSAVVAAGSDYPCAFTHVNVVCVAATGEEDQLAGFSNVGATSVDLAAPGVGVVSTKPGSERIAIDDFEVNDLASRWTSSWARVARSGGGFALTDSPNGNYAANADVRATYGTALNLSGRAGCVLEYDLQLQTQSNKDFLDIETSYNGTTWIRTDGFSGSTSGAWLDWESPLDADGRPSVRIRFRLQSDGSIQQGGASVDDVAVRCVGGSYDADTYQVLSGTSMATPHVAGAAALVWAAQPAATVAGVRAALLESGQPVAALAGKTVTGRRLDAAAALSHGFPTVELAAVPAPTATTAQIGATIDPRGRATTWKVEYGPAGATPKSTAAHDVGSAAGGVARSTTLTGLSPGSAYTYRLTATSSSGSTARTGTFTTAAAPPTTGGDAAGPGTLAPRPPLNPRSVVVVAPAPLLRCVALKTRRRIACSITPTPGKGTARLRRGGRTLVRAPLKDGRVVMRPKPALRPGAYVIEITSAAGTLRRKLTL